VLVSGCERGKIHFLEESIFMKKPESKKVSPEVECAACNGTGVPRVKQPVEPGRRIYPAPCKKCAGKGRVSPSGSNLRNRTE
jgi:DnaJ-class molecular chaperone